MTTDPKFDVLTASAQELQSVLQSGTITSVEVVKQYLEQIRRHNDNLHALIEVAREEQVLSLARQLDEERARNQDRGPLHGIPVIVKDNIMTHPNLGLRSTGGSFAFMELKPKRTAQCIQQLLDAGCILLGKANLSELANFKGRFMPCGWSARGGQTQSPYVKGGWDPKEKFGGHSGPGGSSSGSATSVAAGFAPLSVGTETRGSLIMPATRANVFTLKPSRGVMPMEGIMPINDILDVVGPMARSALDIANSLDAMIDKSRDPNYPEGGYASMATGSWDGLRLGAVNTADWRLDEILAEPDEDWFQQQESGLTSAYNKLLQHGVNIKHPIRFAKPGPLADILTDLMNHNFVRCFDGFLAIMGSTPIRTAEGLVKFNEQHADIEMPPEAPNQDTLLAALNAEPWMHVRNNKRLAEGEQYAGTEGIDRALQESNANILLGPADSRLIDFACASGYPSAMLPLSFWGKNGRPFGVIALAGNHREDLLIQLMSAWETIFPWGFPPKALDLEGLYTNINK